MTEMGEPKFAAWVQPIAAQYRDSNAETVRIAGQITADGLTKPTADSGWTVRDELVHIAASLSDFAGTFGAIVRRERVDMSRFADIDARNADNLASRSRCTTDDVAHDVERDGPAVQKLLTRLTDADQSRTPDGFPITLGQMLQGYAMHDQYHLGQIKTALREKAE
jgi:uncharacterized damage-inducible protein DinB